MCWPCDLALWRTLINRKWLFAACSPKSSSFPSIDQSVCSCVWCRWQQWKRRLLQPLSLPLYVRRRGPSLRSSTIMLHHAQSLQQQQQQQQQQQLKGSNPLLTKVGCGQSCLKCLSLPAVASSPHWAVRTIELEGGDGGCVGGHYGH